MDTFRWGSALGISVALFLVWGALYVIIGVLTPVLMDRGIGTQTLIFSAPTDTVIFGASPAEVLRPWALGALALTELAVLPYWGLAYQPYTRAGARVGLEDMPPFMWVPAALLIPAVILGWYAG